jgi:arabinan endo-1,5-alpha-L-arabinosidase
MKRLVLLVATALICSCSATKHNQTAKVYTNPVINHDAPDPTVIRAKDGVFYAYTTFHNGNVPIYKSSDLVNWEFVKGAFREGEVPKFVPNADVWAPDISYIDGKYVLYFCMSIIGGEWDAGVGRAVADSPEGPFTDAKLLFDSREIGVKNSIDPYIYQEDGCKYLVWGSFRGIYVAELTDDGLELVDSKKITKIVDAPCEGTYIHKRNGYYYFFASMGSCCRGVKSTYHGVVARSKSLFGPYVDKQGRELARAYREVTLLGDDRVKGPGHNSQIVTDDKGQDWILYHGWDATEPEAGRKMFIDKVTWGEDGWPIINNGTPSTTEMTAPYIKASKRRE